MCLFIFIPPIHACAQKNKTNSQSRHLVCQAEVVDPGRASPRLWAVAWTRPDRLGLSRLKLVTLSATTWRKLPAGAKAGVQEICWVSMAFESRSSSSLAASVPNATFIPSHARANTQTSEKLAFNQLVAVARKFLLNFPWLMGKCQVAVKQRES